MKLREAFLKKDFVITCEIGPPKGVDISLMKEHIKNLREYVDGMNVTDNQSSVMRLSSFGGALLIKQQGAEPIMQITCRDRNRLAIQSELLSAWVFGIENVLCITGDHISLGDQVGAKQVFDLDSVSLIYLIRRLNEGYDLAGNKLKGSCDFFIGGVFNPQIENKELEMIKFKKKLQAGARFFQSQITFNPEPVLKFVEEARRYDAKVLVGILVLTSWGMVKYINENVAGVRIPQEIVKRFEGKKKDEALEIGKEIAICLIKEIKHKRIADGVHIMAIGKEEIIKDILNQL